MPEQIEIWRLEDLDGEGIFRSGYAYDMQDVLPAGRDPYRHPCPWEDIPGFRGSEFGEARAWKCGCIHRRQLKEWFPERGLRYIADRARVVVYSVPAEHVWFGSKQVVFDPEHATLARTLDPLALCRNKQPLTRVN